MFGVKSLSVFSVYLCKSERREYISVDRHWYITTNVIHPLSVRIRFECKKLKKKNRISTTRVLCASDGSLLGVIKYLQKLKTNNKNAQVDV